MAKISFFTDSRCEIRFAVNNVIACVGKIVEADRNKIYLRDSTIFKQGENFTGIITIENFVYEIKVYRAYIRQIGSNFVAFENLELMTGSERRSNMRIAVEIPAKIISESKSCHDITIKTISISGLSFNADKPYNIGDEINVCFALNLHDFNVKCRIVRSVHSEFGKYSYGCAFEDISENEVSAIENFVIETHATISRYMYGF